MRHPGLVATMRDNTIEFDINKMDCLTLRQLQDYIHDCSKEKNRAEERGGPLETPPVRKRRRCPSPSRKHVCLFKRFRSHARCTGHVEDSADPYWSVEGQGVHWPKVALGNGLKPYDAEVEPFIPPSAEEPLSLPFSSVFMNHQQNLHREPDTPPESSPAHVQVEDSAQSSPPSTAVSTNQIPIFLPLPHSSADRETNVFYSGDAVGSSEIVLPPPYSVLSMLPPQSTDLMNQQQTLPVTQETVLQPMSNTPCLSGRVYLICDCSILVCVVSDISPPTVLVPTAGLAAIPLVPVSQPTSQFPPFFTANIRPPTAAPLNQSAPLPVSTPESPAVVSDRPPSKRLHHFDDHQ